jgi:hypothetical protein
MSSEELSWEELDQLRWETEESRYLSAVKEVCRRLGGYVSRKKLDKMREIISCILPKPAQANLMIRSMKSGGMQIHEVRGFIRADDKEGYLFVYDTNSDPSKLLEVDAEDTEIEIPEKADYWSSMVRKIIKEFGVELNKFNVKVFLK